MEQFATRVVKTLRRSGYTAFFAGGCVRDKLLGVTPKDFDVATSALPAQVREVFGRKRTVPIGQSFGVITVLGPKPHQVEVATFRSDGEYTDGRHPDGVTFSTPEEDAQRRDFTINGMFYDPVADQVIDYVNGQADLKAGLVRAIGSPAERINEDRLRMLRAVRFAATYSFEIESQTLAAIQERHQHIVEVSQERITHELQRMLEHPNRRTAIELLCQSFLLGDVLPKVACTKPDKMRWQRLLAIVDALSAVSDTTTVDIRVILAALFGEEGSQLIGQQVTDRCRQLKLSNEIRKTVEWIVKHYAAMQEAEELKFSQLQPLLTHEDVKPMLTLLKAVASVDVSSTRHIEHCIAKLGLPPEELNPDPLVRGEDLANQGLVPGPAFAELLKLARDAQLDGKVDSKEAALKFVADHR